MLFKKSHKLLTQLCKIKPYNQAFSSIRDPVNNYGLDFPIKLDGIEDNFTNEHDKPNVISEILNEYDLMNGFQLAFLNTLEALEDHDFEYFENICEERLFNSIKESLTKIKQNNYRIEHSQSRINELQLICQSMTFIDGVNIERNKNGKASEYRQDMNELHDFRFLDYFKLDTNQNEINEMVSAPFVQFVILYKSPIKINIYDKDNKKINQRKISTLHKFIFENKKSEDTTNQSNENLIFHDMKYIFRPLSFAHEKLFGKNYEWKLIDIDDYLNGNPHAV